MTAIEAKPTVEGPKRADARRNRERVLAAAREAFAEGGESTALEQIARRAGVGIGTLYRHFPNRQALLEALYINELEEVCHSARAVRRCRLVAGAQRVAPAADRLFRHEAGALCRTAELSRCGRDSFQRVSRGAVRSRRAAAQARPGRRRRPAGRRVLAGAEHGDGNQQDPQRPRADRTHPQHRPRRSPLPAAGVGRLSARRAAGDRRPRPADGFPLVSVGLSSRGLVAGLLQGQPRARTASSTSCPRLFIGFLRSRRPGPSDYQSLERQSRDQ